MTLLPIVALVLLLAQDAPTTEPATTQPAVTPAATQPAMTVPELIAAGDKALAASDFASADASYNAALAADPLNIEAKLGLGRVAEENGNLSTARAYFLDVAKGAAKDDYRVTFGLGRVFAKSSSWRQALHYLEQADKTAPQKEKAAIRTYLANVHRGLRSLSRARQMAEDAVRLDPASYDAFEILVTIRAELKEFDKGRDDAEALVKVARELVTANPSDISNIAKLARALDIKMDILKSYHNTMYAQDSRGQATTKLLTGREADAAAAIAQVVETGIQAGEVARIASLHRLLPLAEAQVELAPNNASYRLTLGLLYMSTFQAAKGAEAFRRVLEIDPNNAEARRQLEALAGSAGGATSRPTP